MTAHTDTWYQATRNTTHVHAPLQGNAQTRIAIVGGGFAGINTALSLAERGMRDVVVLEAGRFGHGASGRNGGFVFSGYSLGEQALLNQLGRERAGRLFGRTVDAVHTIRRRIAEYAIDCDAVEQGVIWANWFGDDRMLRQRQQLLAEAFDVDWQWLSRERMRQLLHTPRYDAGLFEPDALHLHPLNYLDGLAAAASQRGVTVHENSPVQSLHREQDGRWCLRVPGGQLHADQVLLACGGYLACLDKKVDRAVLPIATYVMVTEPLGERLQTAMTTRAAVYDTRFAFDYYRPLPDTRLLWGGRISVRNRPAAAVRRLLTKDMLRVYPQLAGVRIDHAWSGLMSYARHEMPQIGTSGNGLWWAQAFGGHGLAPTTAAGELLAAGLSGQHQDWREFSDFGLVRSFRPLGYVAAQLRYSWLQCKDRLKGARHT